MSLRHVSPELWALIDSWMTDDEGAVRARIASMTQDKAEEVLEEAVHELVQALGRAYNLEKAVLGQPLASPLFENAELPELLALTVSWMTGVPGAVRARIFGMTQDEVEEVLDDAVHELMLAIGRAYAVEKAAGTVDVGDDGPS